MTAIMWTFRSSQNETMVWAHRQHRMFSGAFLEEQSWIGANIIVISSWVSPVNRGKHDSGLLLQLQQCVRFCEDSVCGRRRAEIQLVRTGRELRVWPY